MTPELLSPIRHGPDFLRPLILIFIYQSYVTCGRFGERKLLQ